MSRQLMDVAVPFLLSSRNHENQDQIQNLPNPCWFFKRPEAAEPIAPIAPGSLAFPHIQVSCERRDLGLGPQLGRVCGASAKPGAA